MRTLHARGRPVLHRDLKPGNVFVGTGQTLKVGDFGMSRYVDLAAAAGVLDWRPVGHCLLCLCMQAQA